MYFRGAPPPTMQTPVRRGFCPPTEGYHTEGSLPDAVGLNFSDQLVRGF